ncbi:MAG: hypothetical protein ACPK7O_01235 [Methanobacterium sp.]
MEGWILDILTIVSIIAGILSIIIAMIAILFSKTAERETRENFDKTKEMMNNQYKDNKDVLSEITKQSAVIEATVKEGQQQLMETVTTILKETAIPKRISQEEQMKAEFLQAFIQNPAAFKDMAETIGTMQQFVPEKE